MEMDSVDRGVSADAPDRAFVEGTVVSATELKNRLTATLAGVERTGEPIVVTSYGRPVAVVIAMADAHFLERFEQLANPRDMFGMLKKLDFEEPLEPRELRLRLRRLLCDLGRPPSRVARAPGRPSGRRRAEQ
jgi:prevent-host-death family protein